MASEDIGQSPMTVDSGALQQVARTLNIGLAVVSIETWEVLFENANFFAWFPPESDADEPLTTRLPGLNAGRAQSRIEAGRAFRFETEAQSGGRTIPISVEIRAIPDGPDDQAVVECHNITKQRQAEYMLDSYSKMAERNARELERE